MGTELDTGKEERGREGEDEVAGVGDADMAELGWEKEAGGWACMLFSSEEAMACCFC